MQIREARHLCENTQSTQKYPDATQKYLFLKYVNPALSVRFQSCRMQMAPPLNQRRKKAWQSKPVKRGNERRKPAFIRVNGKGLSDENTRIYFYFFWILSSLVVGIGEHRIICPTLLKFSELSLLLEGLVCSVVQHNTEQTCAQQKALSSTRESRSSSERECMVTASLCCFCTMNRVWRTLFQIKPNVPKAKYRIRRTDISHENCQSSFYSGRSPKIAPFQRQYNLSLAKTESFYISRLQNFPRWHL